MSQNSPLTVIKADKDNWARSYQCVNFLLKEVGPIFWATEPFTAVGPSGIEMSFPRGTFLVTEERHDASSLPLRGHDRDWSRALPWRWVRDERAHSRPARMGRCGGVAVR
jgi:hypothetical protein